MLQLLKKQETQDDRLYITGVERHFAEDEIIVSKTDTKGLITYANDVFLRVAGYTESEVMGKPHSIVRHPAMPKVVFKLLWDRIREGHEIFAYVVNRAKNGDHYWVFAHVTPSRDQAGKIIGFHSSRRSPKQAAVNVVIPLYQELCRIEARQATSKQAMEASMQVITSLLNEKKVSYDEFVLSL
jgi:PAS domain S-box-containing protein